MKSFQILMVSSALLLAACSGGGGRKTVGRQCPGGDYKPVAVAVGPNQQKVDLKAEDFSQIPAGQYDYNGATLYYLDKSDLRLQLEDTKQKDGSFKNGWGCVRNSSKGLAGPISVEGITSMKVSDDHKILIGSVSQYSISFTNGNYQKVSQKVDKAVSAPKDTITDKTSDFFFVKTDKNDADFEIRTFGADEHGTYALAVRLKRTNNPAPAAP